jgi:hypothetical protein
VEPQPSIHDNIVDSFTVDCANRRIILHTAFRDREPNEFTDIEFDGVLAHHFEHVLPNNILFDIEEVELTSLVQDNAAVFKNSCRYGWPPVKYDGNLDALVLALTAAKVKAFAINSSYGLTGWVLAANCRVFSKPSSTPRSP